MSQPFHPRRLVWALLLVAGSCALPELTIDSRLDDEDEDDGSGGTAGDNGGSTGNGGSDAGRGGSPSGGSGNASGTSGTDQGGTGGASGGADGKGGATGGKGGTTGGTAGTGGCSAAGDCDSGETCCTGTCVDTDSDGAHCGNCSTFCGAAADCTNGVCVCKTLVGPSSYLLIDNLEDGDNIVGNERNPPLRVGYWYTFNDEYDDQLGTVCSQYPAAGANAMFIPNCGNATCAPLLPTPNGSRAAAHIAGDGCLEWGAGMGFDFGSCNARPTGYDGRAYRGISFWYRSATPFRVSVGMIADIPTADGGTCVETECYNTHGANLPASTAGTTVTLPFSMLTQEFGTMRSFDASQLANLQFQVDQAEQPFDLWIDDIAFIL